MTYFFQRSMMDCLHQKQYDLGNICIMIVFFTLCGIIFITFASGNKYNPLAIGYNSAMPLATKRCKGC